jgi:hypothetical protein
VLSNLALSDPSSFRDFLPTMAHFSNQAFSAEVLKEEFLAKRIKKVSLARLFIITLTVMTWVTALS